MALEKSKQELYGDVFTVSKSANLWNDLYTNPGNLFSHNMAVRRDRVCQYVCDHFPPEASLLDLGCGAGVVMEQLIEKGYTVTGADRSQDMLELTRKRLARFSPERYQLQPGSCESLPFADEQFDAVLCVGVFGYIDDVVGALLEIRRTLRPGGILLISIRNPYNGIVSDPLRLLRHALQQFGNRAHIRSAGQQEAGTGEGRQPQFKVDILQDPRPFIQGVIRCGYRLEQFSGFGFGPFAVAGKSLFPQGWSIRISDFLNRIFARAGLNVINRAIGDVSIYTFIKTD